MWLIKDVCVHEHMVQGMSWGQTGDKCVTGGGTEARLETTMEQGETTMVRLETKQFFL